MAPPEVRDVRRGDLYWVDWSPGRGSEQAGLRPALVIQADAANRAASYPNTIVLVVSSMGRDVFTHVVVDPCPANGLTRRLYVKCEQLMTISRARLQGRIGILTDEEMGRVDMALKMALGIV